MLLLLAHEPPGKEPIDIKIQQKPSIIIHNDRTLRPASLLQQCKLKPHKVQAPQLIRKILLQLKHNLIPPIPPFKGIQLPIAIQHNKHLHLTAIVIVHDAALNDIVRGLVELQLVALMDAGLVVLELVEE